MVLFTQPQKDSSLQICKHVLSLRGRKLGGAGFKDIRFRTDTLMGIYAAVGLYSFCWGSFLLLLILNLEGGEGYKQKHATKTLLHLQIVF